MSGDDFADEVGKMFSKATSKAWFRKHPYAFKRDTLAADNPLDVLIYEPERDGDLPILGDKL
jgi:hypothetical protein